jgi:segregation and condensation protein B
MVTLTNSDRLTVADAMIELMSDYAHRDSALEVVETPSVIVYNCGQLIRI